MTKADRPAIDDHAPADPALLGDWLALRVKTNRLPDWIASAPPPAVHWTNKSEAPALAIAALLRSNKEKDVETFGQIKNLLDPRAMANLSWWIFERWQSAGFPSSQRWVLTALGEWACETEIVRLVQIARAWARQARHHLVRRAIEVYGRSAGPAALAELDFLANAPGPEGVRLNASDALDEIASGRGISREDLADSVVPTCGLDAAGQAVFDLGRRTLTIRLRGDLSLAIVDADGKSLKGVPRLSKSDDPAKGGAALDAIRYAKRELKELAARQSIRIERAMVVGRTWTLARFNEVFLAHPVLRFVAQRIVWNSLDAARSRERPFRVAEDLSLADENDEPVSLAPADQVGVAHPLFWPAESRGKWAQLLADYNVVQLFDQIGRAIFQPLPAEIEDSAVLRYVNAQVDNRILMGQMRRAGWKLGAPSFGPVTHVCFRAFPEAKVTAVLHHDGLFLGPMTDAHIVRLRDIAFANSEEARIDGEGVLPQDRITIGQVPLVVFSETLRDIDRVANKRSSIPSPPGRELE